MCDKCKTCCLSAVKCAEIVVMNYAGMLFLGDIQEILKQIDAGIAEHNVKTSELIICSLNKGINVFARGNVAYLAVAFISAELVDYLFKKIVMTCADNYLAAVANELSCNCAAYTGSSACDDCNFI